MPFGLAGYHQVSFEQVAALAERLGEPWTPPTADVDDSDWLEGVLYPISARVQPALDAAHLALVRTHFDPDAHLGPVYPHSSSELVWADTPAGRRAFHSFSLDLAGDMHEVGDPWVAGYIVGVTLATRYHPTWLDWRDEHGIHQHHPDEAAYRVAVDAIGAAVPELADGQLAVRLEFF